MILSGGLILRNGVERADIEIEGGRIARIEKDIAGSDVFDVSGKLILPGFVNSHTHLAMSLLKGYADDLPLEEWLSDYIWPMEKKLLPEDVYWGSMLGAIEMIKTGTVAFNDMYYHPHETAKVCETLGMKALLGEPVFDFGDEERGKRTLMRALQNIEEHPDTELVKTCFSPHAIYTVSTGTLSSIKKEAVRLKKKIHIHLSETEREVSDCRKNHGMTPVEYLDSFGFLGDEVIAIHAVHLTDGDIEIFKKRGVCVVSDPKSELKLASGIARIPELLENGVVVSLGTDGSCSNNNLDMFEEMRFASYIHKGTRKDPTLLPAPATFRMATEAGARTLGLNSGKIEAGRDADLITIDLSHVSCLPHHNILSHIVYSCSGSVVCDSIINGKMVMRDKKILGVNEEEILRKASERALDYVSR